MLCYDIGIINQNQSDVVKNILPLPANVLCEILLYNMKHKKMMGRPEADVKLINKHLMA